MKNTKRIGALICVFAICFTLITAPLAHAAGTPLLGGQQFGAWMAAGLYATSILLNSLNIGVPGHFDEVCNWISTPTKYEETFFDYNWPEPSETISEYMNRSIIKVNQGVTTIDGVEYDELWISPEGAGKVKANVFDFKTKWNILSNNVGTLATGAGYLGTCPIYQVGGTLRSQQFTIGSGGGSIPGPTNFIRGENNALSVNGLLSNGFTVNDSYFPIVGHYVCGNSGNYTGDFYWRNGELECKIFPTGVARYVSEPFEFDYVSGIVPASEADIPDDYGISLKIPHEKLETFYNTYPQYNVENTTINIAEDDVNIDELTQAIFDMIDSLDEIKAEWTNGEQPEPPVPVDPIENIDENVESINEYQQSMSQDVNHMHQDVESIYQLQQQQQQTQQQIQQSQQQMQQDTASIDDTLKDVTATPGQSDLPSFKFDLRELFPFCIPFDIYRLLSSFDSTPTAPHVQLPIVIQSIGFSYTLDLDFSAWDPVAQAMRTAELIVYAIGLAWATGKVIKW